MFQLRQEKQEIRRMPGRQLARRRDFNTRLQRILTGGAGEKPQLKDYSSPKEWFLALKKWEQEKAKRLRQADSNTTGESKADDDQECRICNEVVAPDATFQCTQCKKKFHKECICTWFHKEKEDYKFQTNDTCPLCRQTYEAETIADHCGLSPLQSTIALTKALRADDQARINALMEGPILFEEDLTGLASFDEMNAMKDLLVEPYQLPILLFCALVNPSKLAVLLERFINEQLTDQQRAKALTFWARSNMNQDETYDMYDVLVYLGMSEEIKILLRSFKPGPDFFGTLPRRLPRTPKVSWDHYVSTVGVLLQESNLLQQLFGEDWFTALSFLRRVQDRPLLPWIKLFESLLSQENFSYMLKIVYKRPASWNFCSDLADIADYLADKRPNDNVYDKIFEGFMKEADFAEDDSYPSRKQNFITHIFNKSSYSTKNISSWKTLLPRTQDLPPYLSDRVVGLRRSKRKRKQTPGDPTDPKRSRT